jgi:hypothetical protein
MFSLILGFILCGIAWVVNLFKLLDMKGFSGKLVLRTIGIIVFPLGVLMAFVGNDE